VTGAGPAGFVPRDVVDVGAPDTRRVIGEPSFEPAANAASWLVGASPVVVVGRAERWRAFPVAILMRHQLVSDQLDEVPYVVSYYPLADASAVWDRRVGGRALTFGLSGKVYRADSVLYDLETESLWPQLTGEAVLGPLKGNRLSLLPSAVMTFERFRSDFPGGEVLARPSPSIDYDRNPFAGYEGAVGPPRDLLLTEPDERLPAIARVAGAIEEGVAVAHVGAPDAGAGPRASAADVPSPLDASFVSAGRTVAQPNLYEQPFTSGALVPQVHAMWFAWAALHPGTELMG
jgi:hypothetical protein